MISITQTQIPEYLKDSELYNAIKSNDLLEKPYLSE
jgi:hypothetical protein